VLSHAGVLGDPQEVPPASRSAGLVRNNRAFNSDGAEDPDPRFGLKRHPPTRLNKRNLKSWRDEYP